MDKTKLLCLAAFLLLLVSQAMAGETINGAGASFPYPLYSAWAYDYNKATGIRLNYQSIGSGGGQKQIENRTVDFGASDDPIAEAQLDEMGLYQFPAVIGGVVPVVNLRGAGPGDIRLDPSTLCSVFLGKVEYWDDASLSSLNPGKALPHEKITVVHRSDGSGTTAIFTDYLAGVCPEWAESVGAGKAVKWPTGIGGKGNEGVANYVRRTRGSIGYVEFAYVRQNALSHARLKNSAGNFVEPGLGSFAGAAEAADFDPESHFNLRLVDSPGKDAWPIAGATFILLAREKAEQNRKVARFFDWAFANGDKRAEELFYVPLPEPLKEKVRAYWKKAGIH